MKSFQYKGKAIYYITKDIDINLRERNGVEMASCYMEMFDDRIVVESPGKLPGLVRTDNIRHTHFSRNPRIAEFLKAYNFVKEYGEGVNRMCNELEKAGLRIPEYRCNAFMLQTVIYNSGAKNTAIQPGNPTIQNEKTDFEVEKLSIETLNQSIAQHDYMERTRQNIIKVYNELTTNQIFGAPEVEKVLGCSTTTSKELMKKLRDMPIVIEVKGMGKGKYRLAYESEVK